MVPCPHIVSRTGITVDVDESAFVRLSARRVRASEKLEWFALPGLFFFNFGKSIDELRAL